MKSLAQFWRDNTGPGYLKNVGPTDLEKVIRQMDSDRANGIKNRCHFVKSNGKRCKNDQQPGNAYCRGCQNKA